MKSGDEKFRVLMLGDVFAQSGLDAVREKLPKLLDEYEPHLVIANAENAEGGFGIGRQSTELLFSLGIDVLTGGNHSWEKKDASELLKTDPRILRPGNFPPGLPGSGELLLEKAGQKWLILNLQGRERMQPIDCPFRHADRVLEEFDCNTQGIFVIVDFHAESFQEKEALAFHLDGRVSVVAGTHTHIRTMDERILPRGTGYIGDLGMCGPRNSVIGVDTGICLRRNLSQMPLRMEAAKGPGLLSGALFSLDKKGICTDIQGFTLA